MLLWRGGARGQFLDWSAVHPGRQGLDRQKKLEMVDWGWSLLWVPGLLRARICPCRPELCNQVFPSQFLSIGSHSLPECELHLCLGAITGSEDLGQCNSMLVLWLCCI